MKFSTVRAVKRWNKLPTEAGAAPSRAAFGPGWPQLGATGAMEGVPAHGRRWTGRSLRSLPTQTVLRFYNKASSEGSSAHRCVCSKGCKHGQKSAKPSSPRSGDYKTKANTQTNNGDPFRKAPPAAPSSPAPYGASQHYRSEPPPGGGLEDPQETPAWGSQSEGGKKLLPGTQAFDVNIGSFAFVFITESFASADTSPDPELGPGFGKTGSFACLGFPVPGLRLQDSLNLRARR